MIKRMKARKGAEQPIWLMVAMLLALVIGISMYQLISKTQSASTFDDMQKGIEEGTATSTLDTICSSWKASNWAMVPSDLALRSTQAAVKKNLLNKEEYENGDSINLCDCAVYLYAMKSGVTREELFRVVNATKYKADSPKDSDMMKKPDKSQINGKCHTWAVCNFPYIGGMPEQYKAIENCS